MISLVNLVTELLSFLTLISDILLILLFYMILSKKKFENQKNNVPPHTKVCGLNGTCFLDDPKLKPVSYDPILKKGVLIYGHNFLNKNTLLFAFVIALIATVGSLFYSEIAGYIPCKLCWYQRIFMYPLPILLGIALFKKDNKISHYVIPLSIIGGIISIYHYTTQILNNSVICSAESASCASKIFFSYGYITIPIMALTAFALIIVLTYITNKNNCKGVKNE